MRRLYELILAVFLVCITTVSTLYAQAPGGVTTGLLMWHKADDGTGTPGATTTWADVSGNGRDVTQSNNTAYEPNLILDAVHSADNKEYFFNFNPFYYFDGGDFFYRDAGAIGDYFPASGAGSVYGVMYNEGTAGGYLTPFGWGDDDPNLVRRDDRYSVWRNNGSVIEEDLALTSAGTHIGGMGWQPTGNDGVYLNFNGTVYSNTTTDIGTINDRYFAVGSEGAFLTGAGNERFIGGLPEVFAYSVDHENSADDEKLRINSYLAIKYGITLHNSAGTGASDYLNSASTNVWNSTANGGYGNNVFGIARDDASALHQKQSRSANNNQKLIIGNGSALFNTNSANTNDLVEEQFLIVGDNGLKQQLATPMAYTAGANGETNFRFEAIWKVQNTENVGSVTVAWPKGVTNLYLVQSTDETVDASDTFTPMVNEVTINGVIHNTATVTMTDGTYFTFAGFAHAPGGVVGGLSYWYRADNGVANTGAGTDVTSWTDMFQGAVSAQLGTNALPKYAEGASDYFNFNPGINFTAATQSLGNTAVQTISELEFDIFMLTKEGVTHSGGNPRVFSSLVDNNLLDGNIHRWDGIGLLADQRSERLNNAFADRYLANPGGITWSTTIPSIMYHRFTDLTISKGLNGAANGSNGAHNARGYMNGGHAFGDTRFSSNDSDNAGFIGHLGETIVYGAGNLTETERRRVDSYLAIKYGITLGRVETSHYLASDETIIWDGSIATAYNNNIFGVAKDDIGVFEQKVSRSVNAAGSMLAVATTNNFTLPNGDAARIGFTNDKTYFLLGDNNVTTTSLVDLTVAGNDARRIERIWLAQRTNSSGALYFEADLSAYGSLFTEGNSVYMLVADDAGFTANIMQTPGIFTDDKWVFNRDFDGEGAARYITFAEVTVGCMGPDSDGDGVPDMCDLDADNDGILNTDECEGDNLILNGNFEMLPSSPGFLNPSEFAAATSNNWIFASTGTTDFDRQITWDNITGPFPFGNGIRFQRDGTTQSLTQSISGWYHNGNPQLMVSKIAANNSNPSGNSSTLIVSYAGVEYVRIVTTNGTGTGVAITYSNGASSSLTGFATGNVYNNWVVNLPFDIPASGDLIFEYLAGPADSDDFSLGDIVVTTCGDTDGDGIPDYLDLDSDNDGCPDAIEGDGSFELADLTTASGTIASQSPNQNFGIAVDANGIPTAVGPSGQAVGQSKDATKNDCADSDGDGVPDRLDLDSDNDGILDTDECPDLYVVRPVTTASITVTGTITSGAAQQLVDGEGAGGTGEGPFPNWYTDISNLPIEFSMDLQEVSTIDHIKLYGPWGIDEWINEFTVELYDEDNVLLGTEHLIAPDQYVSGVIISFSQEYANVSHVQFRMISSQGHTEFNRASLNEIVFLDMQVCDTDGDGIPDYLDLDSDGDGCPDALEGGGSFESSDLTTASGTIASQNPNQNFGIAVDANGIPTAVGATGQSVGQSQDNAKNDCVDTDGDGVSDWLDLDSDNDGILDTDECGTDDRVVNGTFPTSGGNTNTVSGWTVGGTYGGIWDSSQGRVHLNANGLEFRRDASTVTTLAQDLTNVLGQTVTINLNDLYWVKTYVTGPASQFLLTVSYGGVIYATIDGTDSNAPTVAANNGASVNLNALPVVTATPAQDNPIRSANTNLSITLPSGVSANGTLLFTFTAGTDPTEVKDVGMGSVTVLGCADTDGDGIPDYLDLDSDGDGCPDAIEGDENVNPTDLNPDGSINIDASGGVNADGVPNLVNAGGNADVGDDVGQGIGSAQDALVNTCATYCVQPGATGTPTEFTQVGISDREGFGADWPESIPNGFVAIESEDSGFVITRVQQVSDIADPQEGMLVYEIEDQCLKLYNGTTWNCIQRSCNE